MKKAIALLFAAALVSGLSACTTDMKELKSPCVGKEGSPCEKRPVNQNLG